MPQRFPSPQQFQALEIRWQGIVPHPNSPIGLTTYPVVRAMFKLYHATNPKGVEPSRSIG